MLKNLILRIKKFANTKVTKRLALVVFVLSLIILVPFISHAAGIADAMTNVFAWILDLLMSLIGSLITLVLSVLINIAQFNEFTSAAAVTTGWVLVRDICNMFFIVILLIISVGTVLGVESYSYKNFLRKVIIMAILINFSKTIAGFLIDVSQVIMLTFVAAFRDSIIVGFTEAFGLNKLKSLASSMDASGEIEQDNFALILGMIFGLLISLILLVVLVAVVAMLAYRIVILWILVVMSPFAYLASALPGSLGGQAKQWWSQFSEQLIVGPAIAFFLWLTLSVVSQTGGRFTAEESSVNPDSIIGGQLASAPFLLNYLLGIMLLVVGMQMAQKMGGKSGGLMGKVFDKGIKKGGGYIKSGMKAGGRGLKAGGKALAGGTGGALLRWDAKRVGATEGGAREGSLLHLAAARSEDKLKGREKARDKRADNIRKKVFGGGDNINAALAARAEIPKREAISKAINADAAGANKLWNKGGTARDGSGKVAAGDIRESFMREEHDSVTEQAKNKARTEWNGFDDARKQELITEFDVNTVDEARDAYKARAITNAENELRTKYDIEEGEDLYSDQSLSSAKLKEAYINKEKSEATTRAEEKYKKKEVSSINPLKRVYKSAEKEIKEKRLAERKGRVFADEPERFQAGDVEDNLGDIKSKAVKEMFKSMPYDKVDKLVKQVNEKVDSQNPGTDGRKKAETRRAALYKALKHLSDEKVSNEASKYYDQNLSNESISVQGEPKKISDVEVKKSTKDYMVDSQVSDDQILNTGLAVENEISNLMPTDMVRADMSEEGKDWQVDQEATSRNENSNVVLKKGDETREVNKDEFVANNASVLGERFYNSDKYKSLSEEEKSSEYLNQDQYSEYSKISKSTQGGITMGSLARSGNMTAVDFNELNERVEGGLTGQKRKAGMFVNGEEAIKAASAMKEMVQAYQSELESAEEDEDIRTALEYFGVKPSKDADLQQVKNDTLHGIETESGERVSGVDQLLNNLNDEERIKSDGLVLVNKSRKGKDAKQLIRHEKAHSTIEGVDSDGSIQEDVWNSMTVAEKESARQYIREDRNQPNMTEGDIRKEYLADAIANVGKNGVIDKSKPKLPQPFVDRIINAKDMTVSEGGVSVEKGKSFFESRKERKAMKKERKENIRAANSEQERQKTEERLREQALNDWSSMSNEQKEEFMIVNGGQGYDADRDEDALDVYQSSVVNKAMNKEEIKRQSEENKAVAKEDDYYKTQDVINATKALFAKSYNDNNSKVKDLTGRAESYEKDAAQAKKEYEDPNYVNPEGAMYRYNEATKKANALRKEASRISTENQKYKTSHEKEIKSLESLASKQKTKAEEARARANEVSRSTTNTEKAGSNKETSSRDSDRSTASSESMSSAEKARDTQSSVQGESSSSVETVSTSKAESAGQDKQTSSRDSEKESVASSEATRSTQAARDTQSSVQGESSSSVETVSTSKAESAGQDKQTSSRDSEKESVASSEATRSTQAARDTQSSVKDRVSDLSKVIADRNSTKEQIQNSLQALEKEIEINLPEEEKNEPDNKKFLEELRKLLAQTDNTSNSTDEEAMNVISGQMDQFLSNIPPGMLNAGKAKQSSNKGGINIPKTSSGSFLSKPLSMAQFLAMKKWFEQQSSQVKKMGASQAAFSNEMQDKIANVNQRISNINTSGGGDVDMKVILEEEGLSGDEIEQIVSNYTSEQEDEE
ncbi:MAG: hypothetical protein ACKKL6_03455 [Candidatus Komeilibacteria bacterium]